MPAFLVTRRLSLGSTCGLVQTLAYLRCGTGAALPCHGTLVEGFHQLRLSSSKGPTNKKRVKKSSTSGSQGSVEENDQQGRARTHLLAQALEAVEHFEECEYPKRSDCTALAPLAMKLAKVYEHCSLLVRQTELMEGLGSTYSQNYDLRPRRGESLKDWFAKVLYRLEYCDMQFQDVDGVMAILETYE